MRHFASWTINSVIDFFVDKIHAKYFLNSIYKLDCDNLPFSKVIFVNYMSCNVK